MHRHDLAPVRLEPLRHPGFAPHHRPLVMKRRSSMGSRMGSTSSSMFSISKGLCGGAEG